MEMNSLDYSADLIRKAKDHLSTAKEGIKKILISHSNIIVECQAAIELSTKAVFKLMGLDFPRKHQLLFKREKEGKIYGETKELLSKGFPRYFAYKEDIPRMVFLTFFWSEFYTLAKYGIEELNLSPDKLFKEEDARLALKHAELCVDIADSLLMWKKQEVKS